MPESDKAASILIADPDTQAAAPVETVLSKLGYELCFCGTADQARALAAERFFNLVFLSGDLMRGPEKDLVARIKAVSPDTVVLVMASPGAVGSALEAVNQGAGACLVKPLDMREVLKKVRHAVEKQNLESRYRTLFHNVGDPIFIHDRNGWLHEVNRPASMALGYPEKALLGKCLPDLEHSPHPVPFARRMEQMLDKGKLIHEVAFATPSGGTFLAELCSRPIEYDDKPCVLTVARDVSERKKLEEQLLQAQKMEAVGRLAGGVAHDFNNLMTVITGYSTLLLSSGTLSEENRDHVREIKHAGQQAAALTGQLLAFSRRQVMKPCLLDLNAVIEQTKELLSRLLGEDIRLETLLAPDLWLVKVDPTQVQQVIMNLAVNSRDAMPAGGTLVLETENVRLDPSWADRRVEMGPGPYVRLTVSDTGVGMDPATQAHVFEPFFTTKEAGKGTGLGLATVHGIIRQSGGHIWLYSEPGKGTTFKIHLPRAEGTGGESEVREAEAPFSRGRETILLVEDNGPLRELAEKILRGQGYAVLAAADGKAALGLLERADGNVDLLLTDVVMPGMSGKGLAREVAARRPDIRVLFMSGYTDDTIARQGMLEEGMEFLQKPFTPEGLARKVREVLTAKTPPSGEPTGERNS